MRRLAAAAALIAALGALTALPSYGEAAEPGASRRLHHLRPIEPDNLDLRHVRLRDRWRSDLDRVSRVGGCRRSLHALRCARISGRRWTMDSLAGVQPRTDNGLTWRQRRSSTRIAALGASLADADVSARVSLTAVPTGAQAGAVVAARISGADHFGARLIVQTGGQVRLQLVRSWLGDRDDARICRSWLEVQGRPGLLAPLADTRLQRPSEVVGRWKAEPASWQLSVVDLTPLVGGSVGFGAHADSGLSNSVEITDRRFLGDRPERRGLHRSLSWRDGLYSGLALGGHVFRVRVSAASNQVTAIYPWTINPPAPTVELTSTPSSLTNDPDATFAWTTTGTVDSTTCTLDGVAAPCTSPTTYSSLTLGEHDFGVEVANAGGTGADELRMDARLRLDSDRDRGSAASRDFTKRGADGVHRGGNLDECCDRL